MEAPVKEEPEKPTNDMEFIDFPDFGFKNMLGEEPESEEEEIVVEEVVEVVPEPPKEKTEYE